MYNYPFTFDLNTAIESFLYLSQRIKNPTLHDVFKLMYWADKFHLENYGRLIFGDRYIAMRKGPVPSNIYDITKGVRGETQFIEQAALAKTAFEIDGYRIIPLRQANIEKFSQSEIDSMDYSIKNYGHLTFDEKTDKSHDESYNASDENDLITIEALTIGMKDNENLLNHINNPNP